MANYDELKKIAKETLDTIADASVDAYKVAEEKARILARKTKLRAGIVNEKATIRRLNVELGSSYYKLYKDNPAPEFEDLCEDISGAFERIALKEKEIEELKNNAAAANAEKEPACCAPEAAPEPEHEPDCGCGCEAAPEPVPEPVCELEQSGDCDCGCEAEKPQE